MENFYSTFLQIKFPSRGVEIALFKYEDIKRIFEKKEKGSPVVVISFKDGGNWYFDGTMKEFKENCETIRL